MTNEATLRRTTISAADEPFDAAVLAAVANAQTIVYARLDTTGKLLSGNKGFYSLLHESAVLQPKETAVNLHDVMVIPVLDSLPLNAAAKSPVLIYDGQISLSSIEGHIHSLSGQLYRHADELWLLAEYNLQDMFHHSAVLEALQDELAQAHRTLMCQHDAIGCDPVPDKDVDWARVDTLTGLGNALAFEDQLSAEYRRMRAFNQPLSLCLLRLEQLSAINAEHGNEIGDEVLRKVADVLQRFVRGGDSVFRLDDNQFAVIIEQLNAKGAARVAERFARVLREVSIEGIVEDLTARFAVVSCEGDEPVDAMLKRAFKILA